MGVSQKHVKVRLAGFASTHYLMIIVPSPFHKGIENYGIMNQRTGVIEAHVAQLAMAIHLLGEMTLDLTQGITRPGGQGTQVEDDMDEEDFTDAFKGLPRSKPPKKVIN